MCAVSGDPCKSQLQRSLHLSHESPAERKLRPTMSATQSGVPRHACSTCNRKVWLENPGKGRSHGRSNFFCCFPTTQRPACGTKRFVRAESERHRGNDLVDIVRRGTGRGGSFGVVESAITDGDMPVIDGCVGA